MYLANIRMQTSTSALRMAKKLQKINPVKIEYERGTIRTIEDKKGDGHSYCPHCEKFYSALSEAEEEGEPKSHINAINRCFYQFETKFA